MSSTVSAETREDARIVYDHLEEIWSNNNTDADSKGIDKRETRIRLRQLSEGVDCTGSRERRQRTWEDFLATKPTATVLTAAERVWPKV
jgi:hypothetical protein